MSKIFSCWYCYHSFRLYQQNKYSAPKVEFRQTSDRFERVLDATKLTYANKTKESVTSLKLGSNNYLRIANARLHKGKSARSPLFHECQLLLSASSKANFLRETFQRTQILMT